ncbi:hypothetical protein [Helicobacter turcicus]|uniref:Uncharacterized protein n=1 Tax=Helicobacter turcicus TaxID=2867412 RepID=A0ABS7JP93_9HELI|nr:hypothetical protein [Helicobacter turcicus]MBX7491216.1 hypothetical protein [Helicobacter turcicus]MBX7546145.1 hypothetical protein [Helicobacter turcicus]
MKILFMLLISCSLSLAGVWSSLNQSGINRAYNSLNSLVKTRNSKIKSIWEGEIKALIDEILKQTQIKEENLKKLEALNKELSLDKEELNFLLKQYQELLNLKANVNAL